MIFVKEGFDEIAEQLRRINDVAYGTASHTRVDAKPFWSADNFNLQSTRAFQSLSPLRRNELLSRLSQGLLAEAYFIEVAGMSYAGKMIELSRTLDERSFYCMMAFDESAHLRLLSPFLHFNAKESPPAFAQFIGRAMGTLGRAENIALIQVLLEGWGMHYYQGLAENSTDPEVRDTFRKILRDEVRHHGGGVVLLKEGQKISTLELRTFLEELLFMVQIGPYQVALETARMAELAARKDVERLLKEALADVTTVKKLDILKGLMQKCRLQEVIADFERRSVFQPLPISEMARLVYEDHLKTHAPAGDHSRGDVLSDHPI